MLWHFLQKRRSISNIKIDSSETSLYKAHIYYALCVPYIPFISKLVLYHEVNVLMFVYWYIWPCVLSCLGYITSSERISVVFDRYNSWFCCPDERMIARDEFGTYLRKRPQNVLVYNQNIFLGGFEESHENPQDSRLWIGRGTFGVWNEMQTVTLWRSISAGRPSLRLVLWSFLFNIRSMHCPQVLWTVDGCSNCNEPLSTFCVGCQLVTAPFWSGFSPKTG
jgi:hypothetical protein